MGFFTRQSTHQLVVISSVTISLLIFFVVGFNIKFLQQVATNWNYEKNVADNFNEIIYDELNGVKNEEECKFDLKYLPPVSIIIRIHNEEPVKIQKMLDNIHRNTNMLLLHEILLIDDCSTSDLKVAELTENNPKIKVYKRRKHCGLARAHNAGVFKSTADVVVIMSINTKVTENWLPPLLEAIVMNDNAAVQPSFIVNSFIESSRYLFNWDLTIKRTRNTTNNADNRSVNFENPLLHGDVIVMKKELIANLQYFDKHFTTFHEHALELSLKLWLCGGKILSVPCSQVAAIVPQLRNESQTMKNLKRIAEVWMDNYKSTFYEINNNARYIRTGSLTFQKAFRENCKSFRWYIDMIVPELLVENTLPFLQLFRASGAIQSISFPNLCVGVHSMLRSNVGTISLINCDKNRKHPDGNQYFVYELNNSIKTRWTDGTCMQAGDVGTKVSLQNCSYEKNQEFIYDLDHEFLQQGDLCLDVSFKNKKSSLYLAKCDENRQNQKWRWGYFNETLAKIEQQREFQQTITVLT